MALLDIFNDNMFSVTTLTDSFNKIPFVPGRVSSLLNWNESGVATLGVIIEEKDGVLTMLNPLPRGGPGNTIPKRGRTARMLVIPHYQRDDGVQADEVQGVREFGQEQSLRTVQSLINERMATHAQDMDVTLEFQRVGATKGIILNADGSTLYNLFDEFGVTQTAEWDMNLTSTANDGSLRETCAHIVRAMSDVLGGIPVDGIHAYCGNDFFDALLKNAEVRASYAGTEMARVLREGYIYFGGGQIYGAFEFGGIVWENYRGGVSGDPFFETDKAHLFPVGPTLWKTVYAPADYMETVNTIGRPRYSKQFRMLNDKGVMLEMQSNALSYCKIPSALMVARIT